VKEKMLIDKISYTNPIKNINPGIKFTLSMMTLVFLLYTGSKVVFIFNLTLFNLLLLFVVKVKVFPSEGVIRRELMLIKVKSDNETRAQIVQIADIYRGKVLDVSPTSLIIELTGDVQKLRGFVEIMKNYGILEMAKTGVTAMSRGERM